MSQKIIQRLKEVRNMIDDHEEPQCVGHIEKMIKSYKKKDMKQCQKHLCRSQDSTGSYDVQNILEDIWTDILEQNTEDGCVYD